MISRLLLWASKNHTLRHRLPRYRFFRKAVSRFMPGEEVDDALREAEKLQQQQIASLLTLLGENTETEDEAKQVICYYSSAMQEICCRNLNTEISVKLTQLGLDLSPELAFQNVKTLAQKAKETQSGVVWIDMEESRYVDLTLQVFEKLLEDYDNVGVCLQAYLYRTEEDLKSLLRRTSNIRLVKGAYAEPKEIAFPRKADVDKNYLRLAMEMLGSASDRNGQRPAFATHDDRLIEQIGQRASEKDIDVSSFEFQMLYGIRPVAQAKLAQDRYRVRVLISYGREWFPWYMRRLAERPANLWFVLKNVWRS